VWTLGIESSCDETAAAVIDPGYQLRGSVVFGQDEIHAEFGGVVPELASREHTAKIRAVVAGALEQAGVGLETIEGIAVTCGPGLIGSLLVGLSFAKALAFARRLPLVGIHHLEGHMMAPFVGRSAPPFPFLALLVSGGHTSLYLARDFGNYQQLGSTRDDAAGEAFDKVAKLLGLGYPGGIHIDRLAQQGDPQAISFPRAMMTRKAGFDFSFSGLKTAVYNHTREHEGSFSLPDLAASFQEAVVDVLARKTMAAAEAHNVSRVVVSGGVSANSGLRARLARDCSARGLALLIPPPSLCTDNAAMIGWVGQQHLLHGHVHDLELQAAPRLSLARDAWGARAAAPPLV